MTSCFSFRFTQEEYTKLQTLGFECIGIHLNYQLGFTRISKSDNKFYVSLWYDDGEGGYWQEEDKFADLDEAVEWCKKRD